MKVDKTHVVHTPQGEKTLAELVLGRSQLIVSHFMFGPEWEAGCPGCSFLSDHLDDALPRLEYHDASLVAVSRAPLAKIEAYKRRMGWRFPWVSAAESDFNHDYHVSFSPDELASGEVFYNFTEIPIADANDEIPGLIAFSKDEAKITVTRVADRPGVAAAIFGPLAGSNINVDMIVQNVSLDGSSTDITFTVPRADLARAVERLEKAKADLKFAEIKSDTKVAKISVIGVGMRSHAGVALKMFETLAAKGINIQVISTSEIKVSVLVADEYTELAVRALHTAYELDAA